ncbi:TRAP transporter substrate-binding protein DctP [Leucobacter sp. NPDC015123]|uniref:TRAP transporter substrate-binding protein DctP n=1 Tax=Leucobacter sp. NPDC015123 TaxID=3364129 RepID=UPI0036F4A04E
MIKRKILAASVAAVVGLALAGCSAGGDGGDSSEAGSTTTISVSHVESSSSITHKTLEAVADRVKERSGGSLELEIYPDGQLGTSADTLQQSASGEPLIGYTDAAELSALAPSSNLDVLAGPFLFENTDQAQTFHESDVFAEMNDALAEEGGVRVLALNYFLGTRNILGKAAYPEPADLGGVKLRVPPIDSFTRTTELLGAVPTTVDYTEVYSALQQGVVDAAENDINSMLDQKWGEAANQLTMTHHFQLFLGFAIGTAAFDALTEEQQQILVEEFAQGGVDSTAENASIESDTLQALEDAGVTITEANLKAYRETTKSYYDGYPEGLLDSVRSAAGM